MTASVMPPAECAKCVEREEGDRRTKNRWITGGQTLVGAVQVGLTGTGIWQFVDGQWLAAGAAAGLAALGYGAIKGLSKLRPEPRK
ncbi:hypothetical protein FNH09_44930 [Streptomyces adustus]|uniref:Uncharacterized protein n=1 Tax=Streptomyces adustus TaxID=1609272 RepID=A0A5N8VW08_9ACTN|nr:DUF1206 domain-containing protein [Streptomyces adustus]MPY38105.1 hypothetical protein [Streptomyces adustus]